MERRCKPSWLDTYLSYTSRQESPTSFHFWVAVAVLSSILQRKVWIPRVKYIIYPNLYIVLIAGSAKCRKSVALHIGVDILKAIKTPPMIFAQKLTTEALIQALEESKTTEKACCGLIVASELSVFLGSDAIKSGVIPTLTDLYDSPSKWQYHTRARGREELTNVTVSMLGASTKDWLRTSIPESAIGGGFTSRIIFIIEDFPSKLILFPIDESDEDYMKNCLIHDLEIINKLNGSVQFTKEARNVALEWYEQEACTSHDEKTDGYFGRKHDTMFKLATILCVSEKNDLLIEDHHIKRALDMMAKNEEQLSNIMESVTSTQEGGTTEKILTIIRKFGRIQYSELLKRCWRYASATELADMLKTLSESQEIKTFIDENNSRWYTTKENA